jgi:peroxiredoxin
MARLDHARVNVAVVLAQGCAPIAESLHESGQRYPFPILCDEDRAVIKAYGVWHPVGIDAWNLAHPASFLIDARGRLRYSFVGRTQFARAPLEKVLAAAAAAESDVR